MKKRFWLAAFMGLCLTDAFAQYPGQSEAWSPR